MSIENFLNHAVSSWMCGNGPDSDIILSTRVRLARNFKDYRFPTLFSNEEAAELKQKVQDVLQKTDRLDAEFLEIDMLKDIEKRVLVEKHLISPRLAEKSSHGAVILNEGEDVSIMINEEDHIRIQCLYPGLQLDAALEKASELDEILENTIDYAFDDELGYLTTCPTNVGTGLRASVMIHLPALVMTRQINRIVPAINQLGLVVRGIYGEGSETLGNIFQISNQMTLGKSEEDIISDLKSVVQQIVEKERIARDSLVETSTIQLEDRVFRSYGILTNSRIIETKEAAKCLSDVRLGIDVGYIKDVSKNILNELMIFTQPGFLQRYAGGPLRPIERDIKRATIIRERLALDQKVE